VVAARPATAPRSRPGDRPADAPARRLLEARRVVEVATAELAGDRCDEVHLARLAEFLERMRESHEHGEVERFVEADLAFHHTLFEAVDNIFLDALFEPLSAVLRTMRTRTSSVPEIREHAIDWHGRILEAVTAGNPKRARESMRGHLTRPRTTCWPTSGPSWARASPRRRSLDSVVGSGVNDEFMRTSELAGQVGLNTETLRYYERRGLLQEPPRTSGGYRNYPAAAVELLRFIKRAQHLGFSLDEVEELIHLDAGGPDSCDAARALAEARRADLEARIADLQRMRDSLSDLIATCERPRPDRACALLEAIEDQPGPDPARSHP
jgi:MerR family mercuric resistance operon transcriptional regulator